MTMRPILLTVSIVLGAAGAASAQAAAPAPAVPPAPPAAPFVFPPASPSVVSSGGDFHVNVNVDRLASLKEYASWTAEAEKWAEHAAHAVSYAFADQAGNLVYQQPFKQSSQIDGAYSQARSLIDSNQYDRALSPLDRVIAAKGERADGATYWRAYTLYKLGRRDEAVATVNQLAKEFPQSPWVRDARALEVEMKQSAGQPVGTDSTDEDVKLLALQGIMRTDPEAAFPVIEKMLAGGSNIRLKERALFVLSQNRAERARSIIAGVAKGNANPDLQRSAIRFLGQSNSAESIATLQSLYRADQPIEVRRAIVSSLRQNHNNTAAVNALIGIARAERDADLKKEIVRHLSDSRTPEAKQYILEILSK
jgi:tetratricopeptide (TPR) repeat protein